MDQSSWASLIDNEIQETYHVHFEQAPGSGQAQDEQEIKSKEYVHTSSEEDDMDIDLPNAKKATGSTKRASRSTKQNDKDDEHEEDEEDNGGPGINENKAEQGSDPGSEGTVSSGTVDLDKVFKSHDGNVLYRIGTWPTHKNALPTKEGAIPMEMIVVAEIRREQKKVRYRVVESWLVQGICIGHFDLGHDVKGSAEIKKMLKEYKPDSLFAEEHTERDLLDKILEVFDKKGAMISLDFYRYKKRKGQPTDDFLIEPPITPKRVGGDCPQLQTPWTKKRTTVSTVVFFTNDCAEDYDFKTEMNLQGDLSGSDVCNNVRKWLKQGGGDYKGLDEILQNDEHEGGCEYYADFEIWVLPQTPERKTDMYCWSKDPKRKISTFMDGDHAEKYGDELYLEVSIIQDENWKEKKKLRDEELKKDPDRAKKIKAARKRKGWDKAETETTLRTGVATKKIKVPKGTASKFASATRAKDGAKSSANSKTASGNDDLKSKVSMKLSEIDEEDFMMRDNADSAGEGDEDDGDEGQEEDNAN